MLFRVCLCIVIGMCALSAATAAAAAAAPRTGDADVRLSGGLPCFTIAEQEERRSGAPAFRAIRVVDASSKPPAAVWAMTMPAGRSFPLMSSMCIPYGGRVPSLPQQSAELLEAGKVYDVMIVPRPGDTPDQPGLLTARFCLVRQADGSNTVRLLGAGAMCGAGAPPARKKMRR